MIDLDSSVNFVLTVFLLTGAWLGACLRTPRLGLIALISTLTAGAFVWLDEHALYYLLTEWLGLAPKNPNWMTLGPILASLPFLCYRLFRHPTLHGWMLASALFAVTGIGVAYHAIIVHAQLVDHFDKIIVERMRHIVAVDEGDFGSRLCAPFGYACFSRPYDEPPSRIKAPAIQELPDYVLDAIHGVYSHFGHGTRGAYGDTILVDSGARAFAYYFATDGATWRLVIDQAHTAERLVASRSLFRTLLLVAQASWIVLAWGLLIFHCHGLRWARRHGVRATSHSAPSIS